MPRYHPALRVLHWTIALLVFAMLIVGFFWLDGVPNDERKRAMLSLHAIGGAAVGILLLARIVVRLKFPTPPPAATGHAALDWLRRATHLLFYAVLLAMVATGIGTAALSGLLDALVGGGPLPRDFRAVPPRAGHGLFANVLLVLLALHLAGVAYHQWIRKDGLLSRMGFAGQPSRSSNSK